MHLECRLPQGAGGMAAAHSSGMLSKRIKDWAAENGNPVYTAGPKQNYKYTVWFEDERYYTLFMLTFNSKRVFSRFELVQDI